VDEFDQAKAGGEADDGFEVSFGLFASEGDALEALDPAAALLDASPCLVEGSREEGASPPVRSKAMMSPEASDFAWIFVVKPPRERPAVLPLLLRPPTHARAQRSNRTSE
jgi:hypothetical protein